MLYKTLIGFFNLKNHVVKFEPVITGHPVYMLLITFHYRIKSKKITYIIRLLKIVSTKVAVTKRIY